MTTVLSTHIRRQFLVTVFIPGFVLNMTAQVKKAGIAHTLLTGTGVQRITDDRLGLSSEKLYTGSLLYSFANRNDFQTKSMVVGFESGSRNIAAGKLTSRAFTLQYHNAYAVLKSTNRRWRNYTGYGLLLNQQYSRLADQYSWVMSGSLALYNSLVYSWGKSEVSLELQIPVGGLGSRPTAEALPKGTMDDMLYSSFSDITFTSLHNFRMVNASVGYSTALSERLHFTSQALFSYKNVTFHTGFLQRAFSVQAGFSYSLK